MVLLSSFVFLVYRATTEVSTLSLHDALPIYGVERRQRRHQHQVGHAAANLAHQPPHPGGTPVEHVEADGGDRKSTRLNSSHRCISYAVFCLKKKNKGRAC